MKLVNVTGPEVDGSALISLDQIQEGDYQPFSGHGRCPSLAQVEMEGDPLETLRRANPDDEKFTKLETRFRHWRRRSGNRRHRFDS